MLHNREEVQAKGYAERSLALILGSQYLSYYNALSLTSLPRLDTLRVKATLKWAIKAQRNILHSPYAPIYLLDLKILYPCRFLNDTPPKYSWTDIQNNKYYNKNWNDNTIMNIARTVIVNNDNKSSSLVGSTEMLFSPFLLIKTIVIWYFFFI